ncbi:MAG: type II toxin-antitoxin system PemK/MazF family toxin [Rhodobacteraceae bacterium]|nr:type II toxin-antitoxin system PemK/MazF family toxin [Paracoccaceae bacterium]
MGRLRINSAPKIKQVYWCEFPPQGGRIDPEFFDPHPVIILSRRRTLWGVVTVVPVTTRPQNDSEKNYWVEIQAPFKDEPAWVLCNHITTVSTKRLRVDRKGIKTIPENSFQEIVQKVLKNLPWVRE